ncbi:MAG: S8 family peptidase [Anaerolineales bacterium]|nr:S8 family peptidase [Anaerolineales bacterium]
MKWQIVARTLAVIGLLLGGLGTPRALAQDPTGPKSVDQPEMGATARTGAIAYTDQIIIKYRTNAGIEALQAAGAEQMQTLSAAAGVSLTYFREMSGDAHVLKLPEALPEAEVAALAQKLAALPEVEYAEADRRVQALAIPNDLRYGEQWHYLAPVMGTYGINLPGAWDITTGTITLIIAVIDTGLVFDHPDLVGRTVAGYDFITSSFTGNDGNGRDPDASDPGDWNSAGECGAGSGARNSSWHGTHVAGTIGAATNNGIGVAGINWVSKIQPVRALGKCGGTISDVVDAIRWSAGLPVAGVPTNPTPARVINLSLGSVEPSVCSLSQQNAINDATAAGAIVVAAAGNSANDAGNYSPGNCANVITVAATNRDGNRAGYSNFGATVEISAPGGSGGMGSPNAVLSTLNQGTTSPVPNNAFYQFYQGTSMAAPHVAGVASLMLSVNPNLTPAQVLSLLQSTATPFPSGSTCSTTTCGAGILNAAAAVQAAQNASTLNQRVFLPLINRDFGSGGLVPNGDFEQGATVWAQSSSNGRQQIRNSFAPNIVTPHSGAWGVWLGGAFNEQGYIQQTVIVPAGAPYLYFYNWIGSADSPGFDFGYVVINGVTVLTVDLHSGANTGGWVKRVINLTAYAGQMVTLQIAVTTDDAYNSNWFIDDVGFQSTP